MYFSRRLPRAAAQHNSDVRQILARLLPLFEDEKFMTGSDVLATTKVLAGGEEVQTKGTRETLLLQLRALAHVGAPEIYGKYELLFDKQLQAVRTPEDAITIANGPITFGNPVTGGLDFAKTHWASALAEWRKITQPQRRMTAAHKLAGLTSA